MSLMEKESRNGIGHLLNRLAIKSRRRLGVMRLLRKTHRMSVAEIVKFSMYVWVPFISNHLHPSITVSKFGCKATFFPKDYYDLEVWRDHFELEDYVDDLEVEPEVIFDLGAHVGVSALYYHLRYPDARIFCFEADPGNYQALLRNVAALPNVRAFNYAICGSDRVVRLYLHPKSVSNSLVERASEQDYVDVQGKSLDSLMHELGLEKVDLIKFNIEGMELEVLKGFRHRQEVYCYNGHLHLDLIDMTKEEFASLFDGYSVKMTPTKPMRYKFYARKAI